MKTYKNPQIQVMVTNYQKAVDSGNAMLAIAIKQALWSRHRVQVGPNDETILDTLRTVNTNQRIIKPQ
jgi:hypothetical protein